MDGLKNNRTPPVMLCYTLSIISKPSVNSNWSYSPEMLILRNNWQCFVPCDLEIWHMTLKNNRAPILCYFKLCALFGGHLSIQFRVTVLKPSIQVKIGFFSHVTLQLKGWPWKTTGHLLYATSSFMNHFVAISQFKLELQSQNTQVGSYWMIFGPVWPRNLMDDLGKQ